jgi:hypothetical protein
MRRVDLVQQHLERFGPRCRRDHAGRSKGHQDCESRQERGEVDCGNKPPFTPREGVLSWSERRQSGARFRYNMHGFASHRYRPDTNPPCRWALPDSPVV